MFQYTSPTDRALSRLALVILSCGLLYGSYSLGRPVYWRLYATVIRPFEDHSGIDILDDDPFAASVMKDKGAAAPPPLVLPKDKPKEQQPAAKQEPKVEVGKTSSEESKREGEGGGKSRDKEAQKDAGTKPGKAKVKVKAKAKQQAKPEEKPAEKPADEEKPVDKKQPDEKKPVDKKPADEKKDFNPDDYPLTAERVAALIQDGYLMVTWANHHYLDFAKSWVHQIQKCGVTAYMVGAMDDDMLKDLVNLVGGPHTWRMNTGIVKHDLGWGSSNFHKMGRFKIKLIKQILDLQVPGAAMVISDIDTAWVQNPIPYFKRFPEADILTSTDELRPTIQDDGLELFPNAGSAFNIGIMVFRHSSLPFVEEWIKELDDPQMWDQTAFNQLSRRGHGSSEPPKNLWKGYDKKLTFGVLPCALFASGHVFFVQRKAEELGLKPYVAHATFQYSGTPGKRHRFREAMLWYDPPEYYDHPKGFVTFRMDIPQELLNKAREPVRGTLDKEQLDRHFNLVNHQLTRLRHALAFATITGRAIVMPEIWCMLDKYWAPLNDGNIPGSVFRKPFICPMDHVLDIEGGWHPRKPEHEFGPHIDFKEYSFLQNPALSKAVNESRVFVEVCDAGSADCNAGDKPAEVKDGKIRLQSHLNSDQIEKALSGLSGYKILDFSRMGDTFTKFSNPEKQLRFERRLKHYTSVICCTVQQPGWIWYDLFFDGPHNDRFNRKFETWTYYRGDGQQPLRLRSLQQDEQGQAGELLALPGLQHAEAALEGEADAQLRSQRLRQVQELQQQWQANRRLLQARLERQGLAQEQQQQEAEALPLQQGDADLAVMQRTLLDMEQQAMYSWP